MDQITGCPQDVEDYLPVEYSSPPLPNTGRVSGTRDPDTIEVSLTEEIVQDFKQDIKDVSETVSSLECLDSEEVGDWRALEQNFERDLCQVKLDTHLGRKKTVEANEKRKLKKAATWECLTVGSFSKVVIRSKSLTVYADEESMDKPDMSESVGKEEGTDLLDIDKDALLACAPDSSPLAEVDEAYNDHLQETINLNDEDENKNDRKETFDTHFMEKRFEERFENRMDTNGEIEAKNESSSLEPQADICRKLNSNKEQNDNTEKYRGKCVNSSTEKYLDSIKSKKVKSHHKTHKKKHKNTKRENPTLSKYSKHSHDPSKHKKRKKNNSRYSDIYLQDLNPKDQEFIDYCLQKYYRLREKRWKTSSVHALQLLKKKYRSLRVLFDKEPTLMLKRVPDRNIFEAIEYMATEKRDEETPQESQVEEETPSLVDPRVMSMSRALESGRNGKVGVEKTFKTLQVKPARSKMKSLDRPFKKPNWVLKPEWSKKKTQYKLSKQLTPKNIGSVNDFSAVSSEREAWKLKSLISQKRKSNEEHKWESKSSGAIRRRDETDQALIKTVSVQEDDPEAKGSMLAKGSFVERQVDSFQPDSFPLSSEKNHINPQTIVAKPSIENTHDKLDLASLREKMEKVEGDASVCDIGGYQIEICRDSPVDSMYSDNEDAGDYSARHASGWQNPSNNQPQNISGDSQNQNVKQNADIPTTIRNRADLNLSSGYSLSKSDSVMHADAVLTVTSDIIPNLYNVAEVTPTIDQTEMSPPILKRETEENTEETVESKKVSPGDISVCQNQENTHTKLKQNECSSLGNNESCEVFAPADEDFIIYEVNLEGEDVMCDSPDMGDLEAALDLSVNGNKLDLVIESVCSISSSDTSDNITDNAEAEQSVMECIEDICREISGDDEKGTNTSNIKEYDPVLTSVHGKTAFVGYKTKIAESITQESMTEKSAQPTEGNTANELKTTDQVPVSPIGFVPFKLKRRKVLGRVPAHMVKCDNSDDKKCPYESKGGKVPDKSTGVVIDTQPKSVDKYSEMDKDRLKTLNEMRKETVEVKKEPEVKKETVEVKEETVDVKKEPDMKKVPIRDGLCKYAEIELSSDSDSASKDLLVKEEKSLKKRLKGPRNIKKRRKTVPLQSQEDDAEELPKIPPPKRRPRLSYIPPLDKKTVDMTEERLMQDFPKHNWLFNKYSETCAVSTQSPEKDGGSKIKQKSPNRKTPSPDASPSKHPKSEKKKHKAKSLVKDVAMTTSDSSVKTSLTSTVVSQTKVVSSIELLSSLGGLAAASVSNSSSNIIGESVMIVSGKCIMPSNKPAMVTGVSKQEVGACPALLAIATTSTPQLLPGNCTVYAQCLSSVSGENRLGSVSGESLAAEVGLDLTMDKKGEITERTVTTAAPQQDRQLSSDTRSERDVEYVNDSIVAIQQDMEQTGAIGDMNKILCDMPDLQQDISLVADTPAQQPSQENPAPEEQEKSSVRLAEAPASMYPAPKEQEKSSVRLAEAQASMYPACDRQDTLKPVLQQICSASDTVDAIQTALQQSGPVIDKTNTAQVVSKQLTYVGSNETATAQSDVQKSTVTVVSDKTDILQSDISQQRSKQSNCKNIPTDTSEPTLLVPDDETARQPETENQESGAAKKIPVKSVGTCSVNQASAIEEGTHVKVSAESPGNIGKETEMEKGAQVKTSTESLGNSDQATAREEDFEAKMSEESLWNIDAKQSGDGTISKSPCGSKSLKEMDRPQETLPKPCTESLAASGTGKNSPLDLCITKSDLGSFRQRAANLPVQMVHPQVHKPPSTSLISRPLVTHVALATAAHTQVSSSPVIHTATPMQAHSVTPSTVSAATAEVPSSNVTMMSGIINQIPEERTINTGLIQTAHIHSQTTEVHPSVAVTEVTTGNTVATSSGLTQNDVGPGRTSTAGIVPLPALVKATSSAGIIPVPALVKATNLTYSGNTGMVIPVQPIIQPLSQFSPGSQIQLIAQGFSTQGENQIAIVDASQNSQHQVVSFSQHPPPLMYQSQPQIIQVQPQNFSTRGQSPRINHTQSPRKQSRKIFPKSQKSTTQSTQIPKLISIQSSQAVCLPVVSASSSTPTSCSSTLSNSSNQLTNILLTQKAAIQNSGILTPNVKSAFIGTSHQANAVKPVQTSSDVTLSGQIVIDNGNSEVNIGEEQIDNDKNDLCVTQSNNNTTSGDSEKKSAEVDDIDDMDDEIRKEMDALDAEIKRKQREQEEMRKKKLELLRKAKLAKVQSNDQSNLQQEKNECMVSQEVKNETLQNEDRIGNSFDSKPVDQHESIGIQVKEEFADTLVTKSKESGAECEIICDSDASDRDTPKLIMDESRFETETDNSNSGIPEDKEQEMSMQPDQDEHKSYSDEVIDFSVKQKNVCQNAEDSKKRVESIATKSKESDIVQTVGLKSEDDSSMGFITEIENVNPFTGRYEKPSDTDGNSSIDLTVKAPVPLLVIDDDKQSLKQDTIQDNSQAIDTLEVKTEPKIENEPITEETVQTENSYDDAFLSSLDLSKKTTKPSNSQSSVLESRPAISAVTSSFTEHSGQIKPIASVPRSFSSSKGPPPKLVKLSTGFKISPSLRSIASPVITSSLVSDALAALKAPSVDTSTNEKPKLNIVLGQPVLEKPDVHVAQTPSVPLDSQKAKDLSATNIQVDRQETANTVELMDTCQMEKGVIDMTTSNSMHELRDNTAVNDSARDMTRQDVNQAQDKSMVEYGNQVKSKPLESSSTPPDFKVRQEVSLPSDQGASNPQAEPPRKAKMRYVELLPAHYNPPRKRAAKGTPEPAHHHRIDTKDILRKLAKSIVNIPVIIQQSCPYISRRKGCFTHPAETDITFSRPWLEKPPAPAHSQKAFQIPGYLIISSKKSGRKRKSSEDPRQHSQGGQIKRSYSTDRPAGHMPPNMPDQQANYKARHHSMSPTSPSIPNRLGQSSNVGPSPTKPQLSPVAAHCRPHMFLGNKELQMTQIQKPPAAQREAKPGNSSGTPDLIEVVDLTAGFEEKRTNRAAGVPTDTERAIQHELSAAVAKRQKMDFIHQGELTGGPVNQQYIDLSNRPNSEAVRPPTAYGKPAHYNASGFAPPNVTIGHTTPPPRQQLRRVNFDGRMLPPPPGQMGRPVDQAAGRYRDMPQPASAHRPMFPQQGSPTRPPSSILPMSQGYMPSASQQTNPRMRQTEPGPEGYQGRSPYNPQLMSSGMRQMDSPVMREEQRRAMPPPEVPMSHSPDLAQHGGMSAGYQPTRMQPPMLIHSGYTQNPGLYRDKRRVQPQLRFPNQGLHGVDFSPAAGDQIGLPGHQQKQQSAYNSHPENMPHDERPRYHQNHGQPPRLPPVSMGGYQPQPGMMSPGSLQSGANLHQLLQQKPQFTVPQGGQGGPIMSAEEQARMHKMKQVRAQFIRNQQMLRNQQQQQHHHHQQQQQSQHHQHHQQSQNLQHHHQQQQQQLPHGGPSLSPRQGQQGPTMTPLLHMQRGNDASAPPQKSASSHPPGYMRTSPPQPVPGVFVPPFQPSSSGLNSQNQPASQGNSGSQRWAGHTQSGYQPQHADQSRPQHQQHQQQQQQYHHHHRQSQQPAQQPSTYNRPVSPQQSHSNHQQQQQQQFNQQQQQQQQFHNQQHTPQQQQYPRDQSKSIISQYNNIGQGQGQMIQTGSGSSQNSPPQQQQQLVQANQSYPNNSTMVTGGHSQGSPGSGQQSEAVWEKSEEEMPHLQQIHGACIMCGKFSLYLCSNCKQIWYCSPECQLTHWQTHAVECKGDGT